MKYIVLFLLCCFSLAISAQESSGSLQKSPEEEKAINFFSMNITYSPGLEKSEINLKLPSLYVLGEFKTKDHWVMPIQDLDMLCPPSNSHINGFLGFQSVNTFNFFNSKAINRFTFDAMGNLVNTELTFGRF